MLNIIYSFYTRLLYLYMSIKREYDRMEMKNYEKNLVVIL